MAKMDGKPDAMVVAARVSTQQRIDHYENLRAKTADKEWHRIFDRILDGNRELLNSLSDEGRHGK